MNEKIEIERAELESWASSLRQALNDGDVSYLRNAAEDIEDVIRKYLRLQEGWDGITPAFVTTSDGRQLPLHRNEDGSYSTRVEAGDCVQGMWFSGPGAITVAPDAFLEGM